MSTSGSQPRKANRFGTVNRLAWPVLTVLLTVLASTLIFGAYMGSPNAFMFAFGGDPLVIYYDMIFHIAHDHGRMLQAMNYPYGELIFLTDAQGALATVLQWIQNHLFPVAHHVPGIIHGLNLYLLPVCSLMVFYILRYFQVRHGISVLFAVLIAFLSPAMLRFGSHFGLAYPFLIPMTFLWFLRKYKHPHPEWRDTLVLAVLTFFSFNNPYTGLHSAGFLAVTGMILLVISIRDKSFLVKGIGVTLMGILPILIPFLVFHASDPVNDRIREQWGFFYYNASLEGLFFPPHSLLYRWLTSFGTKLTPLEFEEMINVGVVTLVLVSGLILIPIVRWVLGKKKQIPRLAEKEYLILAIAATLMFFFAANVSLLPLNVKWFEEHLGSLLMFKASGRMAWPVYFVLCVAGVIFLDRILHTLRYPVIQYGLVWVLAGIWSYEIKVYVSSQYQQIQHQNFFHPKAEQEIRDLATEHQIDTASYQAILVLPKMMAWTDMFVSEINWAAQFYSMRISAATGLPMISAMLSRMSIRQSAEAIQMLSHPVIEKKLLEKLPNRKDLLLLVGSGFSSLTEGEQYLISRATPVYQSESYSLYRLSPDTLRESPVRQEAQRQFILRPPSPQNTLHISFDDTPQEWSFYGNGAFLAPAGQTVLLHQPVPSGPDTQFVFCAWTKIDHHQPGVGDWDLRVKTPAGEIRSHQWIETRRLNDIQDMWIRTETVFTASPGSILEATINSNKEIYVDEIWVYPVGKNVIYDETDASHFLFNGYKVLKPSGVSIPDRTTGSESH